MGLIIVQGGQKQEVLEAVRAEIKEVEVFDFNAGALPENFLLVLVKALENKKWLVVNLNGGRVDGQIYNQLRRLAATNRLQIFHWQGQAEFNLKQSSASRVIFLASWPEIEALVLPEFTRLFGPALDLTEERRNQ